MKHLLRCEMLHVPTMEDLLDGARRAWYDWPSTMEDVMENLDEYFQAVAEIWDAFAAGRIGVTKRENLLRPLRAKLDSLPPSPFALGKNRYE